MMLIIHQKYGLIVVRVTLVGFRMDDVQDVKLTDTVTEAVKELNAADRLLKHMTSDLQQVKVNKVIILPSITSGRLGQTFSENLHVQQAVCQCLGSPSITDAVKMCLCADHLPSINHLNDITDTSHLTGLSEWWKRTVVTRCLQTDSAVSGATEDERRHLYETLLGRFAGPLQLVKIHTGTSATREVKLKTKKMIKLATRLKPPPEQLSAGKSVETVKPEKSSVTARETAQDSAGTGITSTSPTIHVQLEARQPGSDLVTMEPPSHDSVHLRQQEIPKFTESESEDKTDDKDDADDEDGDIDDADEIHILSPAQVQLLDNLPPRAFVTGPPGTGKSSTLYLVGSRWLGQVKDVHILSTSETSRAMSFKLQHQLQLSLRNLSLGLSGRSPQVYRHHFCFMEDEMDEAIDALVEVARAAGGQLYVLIDEAGPPKLFPKFCQQLVSRVPTVHLWATALEHGLRPACLTEVRLTIPYRCPWAVLQEISASRAFSDGHVYQYDQNVVAAEKDGTRMKYMKHKNQRGHTGHYPLECVRCGERLAERMPELGVRKKANPGERQYRDVLILCVRPQDETRDEHGNVTSQASGLVRGLRARGIPVQVVRRLDPDDVIRDVALAISNRVTVADYTMVAGLERRLVVGMGAEGFCSYSDMLAMSRSSGHLLWIEKAKAKVRRSFLAKQSNS